MANKKITILNKGLLPKERDRDKFREILGTWIEKNGKASWVQKNKNIEINALSTEENIEANLIWDASWAGVGSPPNILISGESFYHLTQKFEIGYPYVTDSLDVDTLQVTLENDASFIKFKRILEQINENLVFEDFAAQMKRPAVIDTENQDKSAGVNFEYNYFED